MSPRAATWAPPSPTRWDGRHPRAARHPHELARDGAAGPQPAESEQERAAADQLATFSESGFGYFLEMATRPQTIGYGVLDSPVALAAWLLDHDTDSDYKISRAFVDGEPVGNLTRDHIVTYFNEVDKGGHFAAWEEPELFAAEMRAASSSLR